jgi:hypothetical protein
MHPYRTEIGIKNKCSADLSTVKYVRQMYRKDIYYQWKDKQRDIFNNRATGLQV